MFFPQLVAGPIERPQNLLSQFRIVRHFDYQRVADGLKLIAWGLFKKTVIADRVALFVNPVYTNPSQYDGPILALATFLFAFQIYCDFSGYSDIALGSARVMGFQLMRNFDRPYHSLSISEFWRRWHISLSTWFRDYVYHPLGGNRVPQTRWMLNILVVFLISGLWHGASWTFVIWGALHAFYLLFGAVTRDWRMNMVRASGLAAHPRLLRCIQMSTTFVLVCVSWVFFRATSLSDAWLILSRMATGWGQLLLQPSLVAAQVGHVLLAWAVIGLLGIGLMDRLEAWRSQPGMLTSFHARPWWFRWASYYALTGVLFFLHAVEQSQFIYFQF
jgi:D-alanyl-lipoteichoic acid acyltransferase DltB (MBOAT superfamily)